MYELLTIHHAEVTALSCEVLAAVAKTQAHVLRDLKNPDAAEFDELARRLNRRAREKRADLPADGSIPASATDREPGATA